MYLGSTEIKKICSGTEEVKKVYQGSDLVWQNKPSIFLDFQNNGEPTSFPEYLDFSLMGRAHTTSQFNSHIFSNGFYYYYGKSLKGLPTSGSTNYYRSGQLIFNETGKYKISSNFWTEPQGAFLAVHVGTRITTTSQITSSTNRVAYENTTGEHDISFEINVTTVPYYVNFSASTPSGYTASIRNIRIEPI